VAEMKGDGRLEEARKRLGAMKSLLQATAVAAPPAAIPALKKEADAYEDALVEIHAGGDVASKEVKQKAFDSLRAPVSGW